MLDRATCEAALVGVAKASRAVTLGAWLNSVPAVPVSHAAKNSWAMSRMDGMRTSWAATLGLSPRQISN